MRTLLTAALISAALAAPAIAGDAQVPKDFQGDWCRVVEKHGSYERMEKDKECPALLSISNRQLIVDDAVCTLNSAVKKGPVPKGAPYQPYRLVFTCKAFESKDKGKTLRVDAEYNSNTKELVVEYK